MKKILDNFYVISKLSFSLILLICLIGVLYILYINYNNENKITQNQTDFEIEIKQDIKNNSELITKIREEIQINESTLLEIGKSIESLSKQNETQDLSKLNESIELLNNNFNSLSKEIENLKNNNNNSLPKEIKKSSVVVDTSKNDLIDLIMIKYENDLPFEKELNYLKTLIHDNKRSYLEKIFILSLKHYKGNEYLKIQFDEEVNVYLKKIINKNPNSLFSKVILPYLKISPTSENNVDSEQIVKIKEIKLHIENGDIDKAFVDLKTIDDYKTSFKFTTLEINKYINFQRELLKLK